jgi:hypothetical protein
MLISSAIPAASGAQIRPATAAAESSVVPRRRTLHQHQSTTTASASMIPYSPTNPMVRSSHEGASLARPLMS